MVDTAAIIGFIHYIRLMPMNDFTTTIRIRKLGHSPFSNVEMHGAHEIKYRPLLHGHLLPADGVPLFIVAALIGIAFRVYVIPSASLHRHVASSNMP